MAKAATGAKPGAGTGPAGAAGAAGAGEAGMGAADLRKLLKLAQKQPVRAAFALGGDGKAVLVLDRRKPPRALAKQIKDGAPDSRNHRFGTASVDPSEPKLVRFTVNRSGGGFVRKLAIALRGTGYNKVEIATGGGPPSGGAEDGEA